jgi:DNA-directed RNA polymerase subunit omega
MYFPLEHLIVCEGNMYEITCAAIKRAFQISITGDPELDTMEGKVVSLGAKQVFTKEVAYQTEQQP